ncbi:unknown [Tannerella sp. CAG:118]|nr:unknown [Tannerella sp. CAG:118]
MGEYSLEVVPSPKSQDHDNALGDVFVKVTCVHLVLSALEEKIGWCIKNFVSITTIAVAIVDLISLSAPTMATPIPYFLFGVFAFRKSRSTLR